MNVYIDLETRSQADLPKTGAYKYAMHETTDVLCIAYALEDGEVKLWTSGVLPDDLYQYITTPSFIFSAFNVGFERRIWTFVLAKKYGWPDIPLNRWHDVQADALSCGFPADLNRCSLALISEEKELDRKDKAAGTRLINLFSLPRPDGTFTRKRDFPTEFKQLCDYCMRDVRATREVARRLPYATTAPGTQERKVWEITERMNDRGVPVDFTLASAFNTLIEDDLKETKLDGLIKATGGRVDKATQIAKIMDELDHRPDDLRADTVRKLLSCPLLSDKDRTILEARQVFSNASTAKYGKMRAAACPDYFVRDTLQYHAAATGRFGGRGIQIQNFPRMAPKDADAIARFVINPENTLEDIEREFGPIQDVAKSMLRPTIYTPEGHIFICRDYKSIEAVGTAWATKDEDQLDVFRSERDIYIATAADMYGLRYEDIDKNSPKRQAGKIAVLACGYQGGWKALRDFAVGYGIHWTPKESWAIVQNFRDARPKLVAAWQNFDNVAQEAIRNPETPVTVPDFQPCEFFMDHNGHLRMTLPNGKYLWFPEAKIEFLTVKYETPEGEIRYIERNCVTHKWVNAQNQWIRRSIHGGSLFQSYVQAICREIMVEAMIRLEDALWPLYLTVHDELVSMVPLDRSGAQSDFEKLMTVVPTWASGMPIRADGWEGRRYRK